MKKIALSLLLMVVFAVPAFSQMTDKPMHEGPHGQMMGHHGRMMGMCNMERMGDMMGMCIENADKIGLTDDQIMKMKPLYSEMQKKDAQFKADRTIAEIELRDIMEVKDFNLEKASAAVNKIAGIKIIHHLKMLKAMKEMRTILTDEQFKKMKKMMPIETSEKEPAKSMMKKP